MEVGILLGEPNGVVDGQLVNIPVLLIIFSFFLSSLKEKPKNKKKKMFFFFFNTRFSNIIRKEVEGRDY